MLAIWALGSGTAALFNGVIRWKLTNAKLFTYSLNFLFIAAFGLLISKSLLLLAIFLFINGLGISPVLVNAYAVMEKEVSKNELTEAMTWVVTGTPTGGAIGSAIAGQVIDSSGTSWGFLTPLLSLLLANLALLPYLKVWIRLRSRS